MDARPTGSGQRGVKTLCKGSTPAIGSPAGEPWHAENELLACSYLGEAHAVKYDGTDETLLDHGLTAFSDYDLPWRCCKNARSGQASQVAPIAATLPQWQCLCLRHVRSTIGRAQRSIG